jgi:E3 ubiquitin-protein ligase MARCH6
MQALEIARQLQLANLSANGTSPVTPFNAAQTTSASVGGIIDKLVGLFLPSFSQTLNISAADPLAAGLFKSLYYGLGLQSVVIPEGPVSNTSVSQFIMGMSPTSRSPSLLSDINFLRNLTRHPTVNRLFISIAEGYIITILVVVSFILVFLIREWVVQQQPGINMGAGFNAEFAPAGEQAVRVDRDGEARDRLPVIEEPREVGQRPIARPRRRHQAQADDGEHRLDRVFRNEETRHDRPAPVRDALTPAAEIQRQLAEEPRMTEEFLAIWRRADSDPKEVLRIIEAENKGDQMRYWVNAMKILQQPQRDNVESEAGASTPDSSPVPEPTGGYQYWASSDSNKAQTGSDQGSASGESWVNITKPPSLPDQNALPDGTESSNEESRIMFLQDKGKGKAIEEPNQPPFDPDTQFLPGMNIPNSQSAANKSTDSSNDASDLPTYPLVTPNVSRPRSISDGPKLREGISPLANNNWSFGNLPAALETDNTNDMLPGKENSKEGDAEQKVFGGESAATFKAQFDFPSHPIAEVQDHGLQAWKAAQDLRVQQTITMGREARKSALERPSPLFPSPFVSTPLEIEGPIEVKGLDDVVRTEATLEELFENKPVPSDSEDSEDSEDGADQTQDAPEPNPFTPDAPLPAVREPVAARPAEPQGLIGTIADWLWGGAERLDEGANDEHIVQDLAAEAPFVPVVHRDVFDQAGAFPEQDREVVEAAIAAGIDPNDPDAIDDAEDFEGVMELVGMRGPVLGLIQNALFSAFLLALTVAFGVWIPYNIGRAVILLSANSISTLKLVLRLVFSCAALVQDLVVSVLGALSYCVLTLLSIPMDIWYAARLGNYGTTMAANWGATSLRLSHEAIDRIMGGTINGVLNFTNTDLFIFSAASHEALLTIKWLITYTLEDIGRTVIFLFVGDYTVTLASIGALFADFTKACWSPIAQFLAKPEPWVISLEITKRAIPLDLELSIWDGMDRLWATLAGYTALSLAGALYVRKGSPFSNGQIGREWEATIIDLLNQAGGVMKVILIISIEMLVFPLYCGLLLDAALLPLFEDASIMSRLLFTIKSPLTSIFVHWFVGTCYMFHFALFVSMCRKIMRKGVLCKLFISSYLVRLTYFRLHPRS